MSLRSGAALITFAATFGSLVGCAEHAPTNERARAVHEQETAYSKGLSAYFKYCALCHGQDANGYAADNAPSLVSQTFLESASNEFLWRGIKEGRPGTAMAAYGKMHGGPLDDEEVAAIITFLREHRASKIPLPPGKVSGDIALGEVVYESNCKGCHGTKDERKTAVHLANAAFLSSASDAFLRHAVVHGRPGTPMPPFGGVLSSEDIDNVVALVRSWAKPVIPPRAAPPEPPPMGDPVINPEGKQAEFKLRDNRFVPIADVERALAEKRRIVIIDARAASDWYSMHIPGSISVPYYSFSRLDALPKDGTWITAYCACPHHASGVVVDELRKRGFTNTAILDEGILEWKRRNYPLITDTPQPAGADAPVGASPETKPSTLPLRLFPKNR
ncbi:MAG: c-type cytochrome [Polyangiaceae bacterium]|nr:c-type cytochrome [Polyangiaceae bacterium]